MMRPADLHSKQAPADFKIAVTVVESLAFIAQIFPDGRELRLRFLPRSQERVTTEYA